ncbi:MAG: hypothetical protein JWL84_3544 [Rhodospirillales bacterium]|jgi:hypothetical protein|nr:hypothetical protein [Rhodospirillales bacterium]
MEYRLYLLNFAGAIQASHEVRCREDSFALAKARQLFLEKPFEIREGARRVYPAECQEQSEPEGRHCYNSH